MPFDAPYPDAKDGEAVRANARAMVRAGATYKQMQNYLDSAVSSAAAGKVIPPASRFFEPPPPPPGPPPPAAVAPSAAAGAPVKPPAWMAAPVASAADLGNAAMLADMVMQQQHADALAAIARGEPRNSMSDVLANGQPQDPEEA